MDPPISPLNAIRRIDLSRFTDALSRHPLTDRKTAGELLQACAEIKDTNFVNTLARHYPVTSQTKSAFIAPIESAAVHHNFDVLRWLIGRAPKTAKPYLYELVKYFQRTGRMFPGNAVLLAADMAALGLTQPINATLKDFSVFAQFRDLRFLRRYFELASLMPDDSNAWSIEPFPLIRDGWMKGLIFLISNEKFRMYGFNGCETSVTCESVFAIAIARQLWHTMNMFINKNLVRIEDALVIAARLGSRSSGKAIERLWDLFVSGASEMAMKALVDKMCISTILSRYESPSRKGKWKHVLPVFRSVLGIQTPWSQAVIAAFANNFSVAADQFDFVTDITNGPFEPFDAGSLDLFGEVDDRCIEMMVDRGVLLPVHAATLKLARD